MMEKVSPNHTNMNFDVMSLTDHCVQKDKTIAQGKSGCLDHFSFHGKKFLALYSSDGPVSDDLVNNNYSFLKGSL